MLCPNCGYSSEATTKFCPKCGALIQNDVQQSAPAVENPTMPGMSPQEIQPETQYAAPQMPVTPQPAPTPNESNVPAQQYAFQPQTLEAPTAEPAKKKKFFKKPKFWLVTALVVAVIAVPAFIFSGYIGNFFVKTFSSDAGYTQHVHENAVEDLAENVTDLYGNLKTSLSSSSIDGGQNIANKIDLSLEASEKVLNLLSAYSGVDLSWAKKVSLEYVINVKNGKQQLEVSLVLNEVKLLTANAIIDTNDTKMIYITIDGIMDKYVSIPLPEEFMPQDMDEIMLILDKLPSPAVVERLINRYAGVAFEQIKNVEKTEDTLVVGNVKASYDKYTVNVDEKFVSNMVVAILKKAKNDKDIKSILNSIEELSTNPYQSKGFLVEGFNEFIEEGLEEFTSITPGNEVFFTYSFWVDGEGDIVGTRIDIAGGVISVIAPESGKKSAFEFKVIPPRGSGVIFSGDAVTSGGKKNGKYTLTVEGQDLITLELINFDTEAAEKGKFKGAIELAPSPAIMELVEDELPSVIRSLISNDVRLRLEGATSVNTDKLTLSLVSGSESLISVSISATPLKPSNIYIPKDSISALLLKDPSQLGIDANKVLTDLISKLTQAGFPNDLLTDILREAM